MGASLRSRADDSGALRSLRFRADGIRPYGFSRIFWRRGGNLPPAVRINSGALRSLRFRADGIRPYGFSRRFGLCGWRYLLRKEVGHFTCYLYPFVSAG